MPIVASGVGSGLDITSLITQLVSAEGDADQAQLNNKEFGLQAELSAVGTLKSALSELQSSLEKLKDVSSFQPRSATSGDTDIFTVTADNTAVTGSYDVEVVALAQGHKLSSGNFASATTAVGTGTLDISVGTSSFSVAIDSDTDELSQIRDAINNASNNTGVTASIINADSGSKLILTSDTTGVSNAISITVTDDDGNNTDTSGLSQLVYDTTGGTTNLSEVDAAQDAQIKLDGETITNSTNAFSSALQGVTITAVKKSATAGETDTLSISHDKAAAKTLVNDFIKKYNDYISVKDSLDGFDSETGVAGTLQGDTLLRTLDSQIRAEIGAATSGLTGSIKTLADIGITTTSTGTLELDNSQFDKVVATDFDDVGNIFAKETVGFANRLDNLLENYLKTGGTFESRTNSLNTQIDDIADDRDDLLRHLDNYEARLRLQFGALDTLLSQLQSTSSFLTQQLSSLPGFTKNNGA